MFAERPREKSAGRKRDYYRTKKEKVRPATTAGGRYELPGLSRPSPGYEKGGISRGTRPVKGEPSV